jgi:hypothetical protein
MAEIAAVSLDTAQLERLGQAFRAAPQIAREEFSKGLLEALLLVEREVKENTPTGVTSALRGSVTSQLQGTAAGDELRGRVFSSLAHAAPVELGTKPHFPPLAPLRDWVIARLGVPAAEAESVALLIARKIASKGTTGHHMFERGLSDTSRQVLDILGRAIDRMFARLGEAH